MHRNLYDPILWHKAVGRPGNTRLAQSKIMSTIQSVVKSIVQSRAQPLLLTLIHLWHVLYVENIWVTSTIYFGSYKVV